MRQSRSPVDTQDLPWQRLSGPLRFKLLNGNQYQGPYTMILKSEPREPDPRRGQYHPADEEFLCIAGDFTFDGSTWFRPGSYAFYPAYFVHGTNVHVRGGYEVYLRISDTNKVFWEESPLSDIPYLAVGKTSDDYALQLESTIDFANRAQSLPKHPWILANRLYSKAQTGEGSTLIEVSAGGVNRQVSLETKGILELFAISGEFAAPSGTLRGHSYMCCTGESIRLALVCRQEGKVMVSHGAELNLHIV